MKDFTFQVLRLAAMLIIVEAGFILITGNYMDGEAFGFGWEGLT